VAWHHGTKTRKSSLGIISLQMNQINVGVKPVNQTTDGVKLNNQIPDGVMSINQTVEEVKTH